MNDNIKTILVVILFLTLFISLFYFISTLIIENGNNNQLIENKNIVEPCNGNDIVAYYDEGELVGYTDCRNGFENPNGEVSVLKMR
jgi:hypothetical protein